ncbi:unnamed protein product [marine sediment metagenome]|uniref:Uncharacterized protein n=1 Tax=marine sediment metagenome TaxID=412755 RepID=X1UAT7_9ZZZZ
MQKSLKKSAQEQKLSLRRLNNISMNKSVSVDVAEEHERVTIPSVFSRNYLIRDEVKVNLTDYNKYFLEA